MNKESIRQELCLIETDLRFASEKLARLELRARSTIVKVMLMDTVVTLDAAISNLSKAIKELEK